MIYVDHGNSISVHGDLWRFVAPFASAISHKIHLMFVSKQVVITHRVLLRRGSASLLAALS